MRTKVNCLHDFDGKVMQELSTATILF